MESKHSILYLDDEEQNLVSFQALLRKDYTVYTTTDAHEATEILSRENIAVIFSDQKMPDVSGVEFFENIVHEFPTPVRILLTGHADIEAVIDAINKGQVYRYVSKPWEAGDLKICIENAIEKFKRDADLLLKKSLLQSTYSEMAIAQIFNHLFELITQRIAEQYDQSNAHFFIEKIKTQQHIASLNVMMTKNHERALKEKQDVQDTKEFIVNTFKYCNRIDGKEAILSINCAALPEQSISETVKIIAILLHAINLSSGDESHIIPSIEVIENQEKQVGKLQLILARAWNENELNTIQLVVDKLGIYLNNYHGSIQLEMNMPNTIRITFDSQLI